MKIVVLNAGLSSYLSSLEAAGNLVGQTLEELGMEVVHTNLALIQIPYYDGARTTVLDNLAKSLEAASGVVLLAGVSPLGVGAAMAVFVEHLAHPWYAPCMQGKNCMVVLSHMGGGARTAMSLYGGLLNAAGANDPIRLALREQEEIGQDMRAYIERQTEDFYRIIRANKGFFLLESGDKRERAPDRPATNEGPPAPRPEARPQGSSLTGIDLQGFREAQERDINEITQYFARKLAGLHPQDQASEADVLSEELELWDSTPVPPRMRTCRQLTQSMTHHFQPHMASGVEEVIQLLIGGDESFSGYISIERGQCYYHDGEADTPDITIISDSDTWTQVLKGRVTAQKAFMVGQLKVRGKFVTLSKFEQYFNTKALS